MFEPMNVVDKTMMKRPINYVVEADIIDIWNIAEIERVLTKLKLAP
jgi:hypothetical protein